MMPPTQAYYSLGLTGYPLSHSLSPRIISAALRASGLKGEYRLYPVPPMPAGKDALDDLISSLRNGNLDGLNVTLPHKQTVIPYLDILTPMAEQIGAVNTIFRQDGKLVGDNTDAPGFMADLYRHFPVIRIPQTALVLGAGGSARAVVYGLLSAGWHVVFAARRPEKAYEIINGSAFNDERCEVIKLEELPEYTRNIADLQQETMLKRAHLRHPRLSLIVNATPVGMHPNVSFSPWPEDLPFPTGAFVYDLVYNPQDTRLICAAHSAGLATASGLGMLIEQAALAFECWTGVQPSKDAMCQEIAHTDSVSLRQEN